MHDTRKRMIQRHYGTMSELREDTLAEEQCLSVVLGSGHAARTSCTPGNERALVLGYCFTEGLIASAQGVRVDLTATAPGRLRAVVHVDARATQPPPKPRAKLQDKISAERIFAFMESMERTQEVFKRTGATHCAALYEPGGAQLAMAEDIGRHNALDKVIGMALENGSLHQALVATISSRLSSDLVEKASAAGLRFLCGISVATTLAADLAEERGITLIGRIRDKRMNIYAHKERVRGPHPGPAKAATLCRNAS